MLECLSGNKLVLSGLCGTGRGDNRVIAEARAAAPDTATSGVVDETKAKTVGAVQTLFETAAELCDLLL